MLEALDRATGDILTFIFMNYNLTTIMLTPAIVLGIISLSQMMVNDSI